MASKTDIANLALTRLEVEPVDNIDSSQEFAARTLRRVWDVQLAFCLASHTWNFCTTWWKSQAAVTADQNPSPFHASAILVPPGCLKVIQVGGNARRGEPYIVAEGYICTDAGVPAHVRGIKMVNDPGRYSIWFVEYFSARLAWTCGKPLNASEALREAAKRDALRILDDARSLDGQEGDAPQLFADAWLDSRLGGDWLS